MPSKSRLALVEVLTRKAMLDAQFFQHFLCGLRASGLHVFVAFPNGLHGFIVILLLPREIIGQHVIQRGGGVLSVPLSVVVQLRLSFGSERDHFHIRSLLCNSVSDAARPLLIRFGRFRVIEYPARDLR